MENYLRFFDRYLNNLKTICQKIERHSPNGDIFDKRLQPGMLPFINQVKTACNFAIRGIAPLVNEPITSFDQGQADWPSLYHQISETRQLLSTLATKEVIAGTCTEQAGFATVALNHQDFIELYIIPNFLFHISMVYAIARAEGVDLSKGDFDGFHSYPEGFAFDK